MNIIDRVKNILFTPKTEWDIISEEETTIGQVVSTYIIPLAIVSAAASFIGYGFIGVRTFWGFKQVGMMWGMNHAVIFFVTSLIGVYVSAYIINMLAPSFGSEKNLGKASQLVAYSYTPALIGGIFNILPMLGTIGALLGLYGIYLMYLGMPKLMNTPEDKVVVYILVSILIMIVVSVLLTFMLGAIMLGVLGIGAVGSGL